MIHGCKAWLIYNAASGSNDPEALAMLDGALNSAGCNLERKICFPEEDAPDVEELRSRGVDLVVIFAGDGTIGSVVTGLFGWEGSLLVLPGGTMNLLARRLHGEVSAHEIIARLAASDARKVRPTIVGTRGGYALTGVLAGPGTAWNDVREAMRSEDLPEMVSAASAAVQESVGGAKVVCRNPACGREEGYAAIMISPQQDALEARGYYAESFTDYASQAAALLQGDFRDGPNDLLGTYDRLDLSCPEGEPMGLLIDGEPSQGSADEVFRLARCGVDLLATIDVG
ncbi:MAG: acylglycerol kinase family protein [Novosphingobium sp.]|nr:acylglycerol kinase family protein [Novosphingobium sp.]